MKTKWVKWRSRISYGYKVLYGPSQERNRDSHDLTAVCKIPLGGENTTEGRASPEAVIAAMVAITQAGRRKWRGEKHKHSMSF